MTIHPIVVYGEPVLHRVADKVTEFDDELRTLVTDMFETLAASNGVGLAAPQIGELKRVFVVNLYGEPDEEGEREKLGQLALINPEIIERHGEQQTLEGCLSIPGLRFDGVDRAQTVKVRYQDTDGEHHEITGDDYLAQALQHEQDHLDGILYLDSAQMRSLATDEAVARWWGRADTREAAAALGFAVPATSVF